MALTPKQAMFVQEYLVDLNATQAAIRAGYAEVGARTEGSRLLAKPEVADAIQAAHSERAARVGVQSDAVLRECARLGLSDVRKLFNTGRLLAPHEWDDDTAASVASVEVDSRREPGEEL